MSAAVCYRSILVHPAAIGGIVVAVLAAIAVRTLVRRPAAVVPSHTHGTVVEEADANLDDPRPGYRLAAVEALAGSKDATMRDTLEGMFRDSDAQIRIRAAEILHRNDPEAGQKLLLAALMDGDVWLRQDAAKQMALLANRKQGGFDRRIVPFLMRAVDDYEPIVQVQAIHGLKKLTGNNWGISYRAPEAERDAVRARWRMWWRTAQVKYPIPAAYQAIAPLTPTRTDPAPPVSVRTVDGQEIKPFAPQGRLTLLNFWGTWCGPCQAEVPDLQKIHEMFGGRGVDVVGIAMAEKEGPRSLRAWCAAHGLTYAQALAEDDVLHAYGDIDEVPISFLIDGQGRIRYRWEGERDFATFRNAIENVQGKTATP